MIFCICWCQPSIIRTSCRYECNKIKSLQASGKQLTLGLVKDKEVQDAVKEMLIGVLAAPEIKESIVRLIESTFTTERSITTIVSLLEKSKDIVMKVFPMMRSSMR